MKIIRQLIEGDNTIIGLLPTHHKKDLLGILFLISNMNTKFFTHRLNDDWLNLSQNMKYSLFSQNRYRQNIHNNPSHIFNLLFVEMYKGNSINSLMSGYEPTLLMKDIYEKWIVKNEFIPFDIIDIKFNDIKISKDEVYKDNAEYEYDICEEIDINPNPINEYISTLLNGNKSIKDLKTVVQLKEILGNLSHDNKLKLYYKEVISGRYYSVGKHHIQGLKKEIRKIVLSGYHDYDLNTSAPVFLCQIYKKITGKNPPQSVVDFIDEKEPFRRMLSICNGISMDDSKMFYTSLFFNAKLIPNDFKHITELSKKINPLIINKILQSDCITQLRKDIQLIYSTINKHYRKNIIDGHIVGYKNKKYIPKDNKLKSTVIVSHVYQSLESVVLDTMINYYKEHTSDTNYVRIHDCIYTKKPLDEIHLEDYILEKTGFFVMIKDRPSETTLRRFVDLFDARELFAPVSHLFDIVISTASNNELQSLLKVS